MSSAPCSPLVAAIALGCAACSPADVPLIGPCSASSRVAPNRTYQGLALTLVFDRISGGLSVANATPETVAREKARLANLRADWLPTIEDGCLRAHASDWISFYGRKANSALDERARLNGHSSEHEQKRAEEEDQRRALASRLGVRP